jgi:hypothetical protein
VKSGQDPIDTSGTDAVAVCPTRKLKEANLVVLK